MKNKSILDIMKTVGVGIGNNDALKSLGIKFDAVTVESYTKKEGKGSEN